MAKSKKKKFLRLIAKSKKVILGCLLLSILIFLFFSYSQKPPRKSEIQVHTGYIQSFKSYDLCRQRSIADWDAVIVLNNQQFCLQFATEEELKLLQDLQNAKTQITIEIAERNIVNKIINPSCSNIPNIYGMRAGDQIYRDISQKLKDLIIRQVLGLSVCPIPLIALVFILKYRWESA